MQEVQRFNKVLKSFVLLGDIILLNLLLWVSEKNIIEWELGKNFLKEPDILHKKKDLVLYK